MTYFVNDVLFGGYQLKQARFEVLSSAPTTLLGVGRAYVTTGGDLRIYDGSTFGLRATDSALLNGANGASYLNRANHTGTQTAATISDLATTVKAYKLSDFAVPTANIPMGGYTFTGISTNPVAAGQAAEYSWVLAQISNALSNGVKGIKDPVRALFASNISLTGVPSTGAADGVSLAAGDRVALTGQTTGSENGIWLVQTGGWSRPTDFDQSADITGGTEFLVNEGTTYGGTVQRITNTGAITLGTTALTFSQVNRGTSYTAGNGLTLTGTVFAVQPVSGGGLVVSGSGVAVDTTLLPIKKNFVIGDGSATSFTLTHNLNTVDVIAAIKDSAGNVVLADWQAINSTQVVVGPWGTAPAANSYRVLIIG